MVPGRVVLAEGLYNVGPTFYLMPHIITHYAGAVLFDVVSLTAPHLALSL